MPKPTTTEHRDEEWRDSDGLTISERIELNNSMLAALIESLNSSCDMLREVTGKLGVVADRRKPRRRPELEVIEGGGDDA